MPLVLVLLLFKKSLQWLVRAVRCLLRHALSVSITLSLQVLTSAYKCLQELLCAYDYKIQGDSLANGLTSIMPFDYG